MSRANQVSHTNSRRRVLVDRQVQGALLRQALIHWLWTTATCGLIVFVFRVAPDWLSNTHLGFAGIWYHLAPFVVASVVLLPILSLGAIRFSHRFAGPMIRVRSSLKQLAQGENPPVLAFRDRDFWSEIADDINMINGRLNGRMPAASGNRDSEEGIPAEGLAVPPTNAEHSLDGILAAPRSRIAEQRQLTSTDHAPQSAS